MPNSISFTVELLSNLHRILLDERRLCVLLEWTRASCVAIHIHSLLEVGLQSSATSAGQGSSAVEGCRGPLRQLHYIITGPSEGGGDVTPFHSLDW